MLLNYLYANFQEEGSFCTAVGATSEELEGLRRARVFPSPSYVYQSKGHSTSFVTAWSEDVTYRFHLRGHARWFQVVSQFDLTTETRARQYFLDRYDQAKTAFLTSSLGVQLVSYAPDVPAHFDADHAQSTWQHFLNGVYGVCTRDGQPESVFLKQAGVMFIEQLIAKGPGTLSKYQLGLLHQAVDFLDGVESDFAPHEAAQVSRQRCIVDVKEQYFRDATA